MNFKKGAKEHPILGLVLLSILCCINCIPVPDVTYHEIQSLGGHCFSLNRCKYHRHHDKLNFYNCNCDESCMQFDTCCIDAPSRSKRNSSNNAPNCINTYGNSDHQVFVIDQCSPKWSGDASAKELCSGNGEVTSDPFQLIPVTSTQSGMTYKNYFCYRCNEEDEDVLPIFWLVRLSSSKPFSNSSIPSLRYHSIMNTWMIKDEKNSFVPVSLKVEIPPVAERFVRNCRGKVISDCSLEWNDKIMREKCSAYMGLVSFSKNRMIIRYRNIHCAICNFEKVHTKMCFDEQNELRRAGFPNWFLRLHFALLIDINFKNGEDVGKVHKCDTNSVYDPFAKKCRVLGCALPGFSMKNGKCVKQKIPVGTIEGVTYSS